MIKVNEITKLSNPEETVDKRTTYLMTKNPDMTSIKDVEDGTQLDIAHVCRFTDTNKDGGIVEIATYLDNNGNVYATKSTTFKEYFDDILDSETVYFDEEAVYCLKWKEKHYQIVEQKNIFLFLCRKGYHSL